MNTKADIMAAIVEDAPSATSDETQEDSQDQTADDVTDDADGDGTSSQTDETTEEDSTDDADADEPEGDADPEEDEPTDADDSGDAYTFTVDGEEVTATVAELIENYSIDGAARKRLQEATETRKEAQSQGYQEGMNAAKEVISTRTQELDNMREQLNGIVGFVGKTLFQPFVQRPDPRMEQTDPLGYLSAMERYREDQDRIHQMQGSIQQFAQQMEVQQAEMQKSHRQSERIALRQARPDLADKEKAAAFTKDVRTAQNALGFTQEEVDNFPDHRGLLVLELAGKYIASQNAQGDTPAQRVVKKAGKSLKPGGAVRGRTESQKAKRKIRDKARKTGDYKDVAKLLIEDAPRRR